MLNAKFIYMKLLGFFTSIIGFSYSLTCFYNFFDVIFRDKIITSGINIWVSLLGLIFPLFIFVFGVFFYFYADVFSLEKNKWINYSIIISIIISLFCILTSIIDIGLLRDSMEFLHYSFGYVLFVLNILYLYGKYRYKF